MDTILIVDDSAFIVEGMIAFLKKKFLLLAAYNGAECLEILRREKPSVIILDIMMEPMDGWETLARIKENPETRHIPVLMFSAMKISPEDAKEHQISFDDCLTKPVSPNKIVEAIEKVLARRDTTLLVVERWQSAGISQDKIEEYLALVTNLEVDLSLCQNMKLQYDLGHAKDYKDEEFQSVIRAVEDRIVEERDQIEALAREMNRKSAGSDGSRDPPVISASSPEEKEPGPLPVSPAATGDTPAMEGDGTASQPVVEPIPEGMSSHGISEPAMPVLPEPPALPDAVPAPGLPETVRETVPAGPPGPGGEAPGEPGSRSSESGPVGSGENPGGVAVPGHGTPADSPEPPEPVPPHGPSRTVIPAEPDLRPDTPGISSGQGAGTDVPMIWDASRERKNRVPPSGPVPEENPKKPEAPHPAPGLFSRILSVVRSLFGRRT
jgi:two-component system, OmpR family, response regulator